ncbi:hypothetical protein Sste5346_006966 [Sporothrix stenoceras]|uniref:Uncharacterized protein n=1 Tax=Sporothrix stenoceras TaxID=5173 RepID=A0ABR3YVU4_9PEZI
MVSKKGSKKSSARSSQTPAQPGSNTSTGAYEKLINRMYEPLVLLHALDPIRGDHIATTNPPINNAQHIRRQFRDDLAFLCEYDKGGDACTALGIEDREDCLIYWVAANANPQKKIEPFLVNLLGDLAAVIREGGGTDTSTGTARLQTATEEVTAKCAAFALPKIKKICTLLRIRISDCEECLGGGSFSDEEKQLAVWLQQFKQSTKDISAAGAGLDLCRLAYDRRKSREMRQLKQLALEQGHHGVSRQCFAQAHHYIGRLADHVRVPPRLVSNLQYVEDLLLNPLSVQVPPMAHCAPCEPLRQEHGKRQSRLEGIISRMCKPHEKALLAELAAGLQDFSQNYDLDAIVHKKFADLTEKSKAPRVHAEVQILEHFHRNKLDWADNGDRYIGCSKPACFCCHLYFRHHPLRPVMPGTHNKVYPKWGPPLLDGGTANPGYIEQRDLLNRFIEDVRKDVVEQIRAKRGPSKRWQADTATAITQTVAGDFDGVVHVGDDSGFESSDFGDYTLDNSRSDDNSSSMNDADPTPVEDLSRDLVYLDLSSYPDADSDSDPEDGGVDVREWSSPGIS